MHYEGLYTQNFPARYKTGTVHIKAIIEAMK